MSISRYCKHYNLLFSPDLVQRVYERQAKYAVSVDKGLSVRDEAQRAYRLARAAWHAWQVDATESAQRQYICHILEKVLGYSHLTECPTSGITPEEQKNTQDLFGPTFETDADSGMHLFPISLLLGAGTNRPVLPVIIAPADKTLDAKIRFSTGQHLSATQMMQAFLNASEFYTWAIVTNGSNWRLLRDNPALSRPCYLDIDLDRLLDEEDSSAFDGLFWHMLHVTRAARQISDNGETCIWEQWRQDLEEHGARARDGLREGVENAICQLGTGFLQGRGPGNDTLRAALQDGSVTTQAFYQELMRTVYRLIFLTVLEGRNILHEHDKTLKEQAQLYRRGYSISRLIKRALREDADSRHDDLWQAQLIVFRALGKDGGESALALPALGGLYDAHQCPLLDACRLPNSAFLAALRSLCWTNTEGKRTQVDYAHIGAEELGSVYESLLELTPRISTELHTFYFMGGSTDPEQADKKQKGNARKLTGSYYTPTCLVEQVLKTALDPLLDACGKNQKKLLDLRVIDPACGSGHFLLGAARRIAERLADARTPGQMGGATPDVFQRAMHDVIRYCIYGVDINPMAIELVRMNLWLEGYQPGKALSFLDAHLRHGNSLLGLFSAEALQYPIPADAYKCLPGDNADVCKAANEANRKQSKARAKSPYLPYQAKAVIAMENMPEDSPSQVQAAAAAWQSNQESLAHSTDAVAADIWMGAFLVPKTEAEAVPTTRILDDFLNGLCAADNAAIQAAQQACRQADVFHWHLAFPEVFEKGGFDCVLGNPPWDKVQLKEEEWFAERHKIIAKAKGATRKKYIKLLSVGELQNHFTTVITEALKPSQTEIDLHKQYESELHFSLATNAFYHTEGGKGGRYPLTGTGGVDLYALFSETFLNLRSDKGRASFIVPTGIATNKTTCAFFLYLVDKKILTSIFDFNNRYKIFPSVHTDTRFSCFTIAPSEYIDVACYMTNEKQLEDKRILAKMSIDDFSRINPNTGTCPLFRCEADAAIAVKLYRKAPILINENTDENAWGLSFKQGLFNMTTDDHLFLDAQPENEGSLPLYEGKLIYNYDHRYNTFDETGKEAVEREVTTEEKTAEYEIGTRHWVRTCEVLSKLPKERELLHGCFLGFRGITNPTNERTFIMSFFPSVAVGHSLPLLFTPLDYRLQCCLLANGNALIFDYLVRLKVSGKNMSFFLVKQFPFLSPSTYSEADIAYISTRVLELSYTSYSMRPLAEALGYTGNPFPWDEDRRAQLKAELDAYYAKLYGLTREELAYILDPTTKYPTDCPTVTFPTLQNNEMKKYGEYRTQRLVLAAFDELTRQGK